MSDIFQDFYPKRFIQSDEPGLVAGYTFADNELAQFGTYINRSSGGALYDLIRSGTPIVAQGDGLLALNGNGYYYCNNIPIVDPANASYDILTECETAPAADRSIFGNGPAFRQYAAGTFAARYNGGTDSVTPFSVVGRGQFIASLWHDGAAQHLSINGRDVDSDNVAPGAFGGNYTVGTHNAIRGLWMWNTRSSAAAKRAFYIRDFASKVLWQWQPRDVGEGPAGGILTNSIIPFGEFFCPLGSATQKFVWLQKERQLALYDSDPTKMSRIEFMHAERPVFGSWVINYKVLDPSTASLIVGLGNKRGVDPTTAGSQAYWIIMRTYPGPWWRTSLYYENGAQIDAVDTAYPGPSAGDTGKILLTHSVNGDWQLYNYVDSYKRWYWSTAVGNDVSKLSTQTVTIASRGVHVLGITRYQSEMTPNELPEG